jgi:hypothetical protein
MKKSIIVAIASFILLPGVMNTLYAQRGGFDRGPRFGRGPMTPGIQYDYFDPLALHQSTGVVW